MNATVDADQDHAIGAIWSTYWSASGKWEEDLLSAMWRAYVDGKSKAQILEKSSSGVGQAYLHWPVFRCSIEFELSQRTLLRTLEASSSARIPFSRNPS